MVVKRKLSGVVEEHVGNVAARIVGKRTMTVVIHPLRIDGVVEQTVGVGTVAAHLANAEHIRHHMMENGFNITILRIYVVGHRIAVRHTGGVGVIHQVVLHHLQGVLRKSVAYHH